MTEEALVIDYAWEHPNPQAIKDAGYVGVIRYLSNDPSKNLSRAEATALHKAGLSIRLVWESTATRPLSGWLAGRADRKKAEALAKALGYPTATPIHYACDANLKPGKVEPYYKGTMKGAYPNGDYGPRAVIEDLHVKGITSYHWQAGPRDWGGDVVSKVAHLYQRTKATRVIKGAKSGWDENVVLHPFPAWTPTVKAPAKPAAKPVAKPATDVVAVTPTLTPSDVTFLQALIAFLRRIFTTGGK